jgi:hypothetical protein
MKANGKTQTDSNMNFDGMERIAPKHGTKYMVNQHTGYMNDGRLVNKGRGPTVGNTSNDKTPGTAGGVPSVPAQGSVRDNINRGSQVRTPGGTRTWDPSATQNYKGNPDKINEGRGPTKGNQV